MNTIIDYSIVDGEKEYFLRLSNANIRIGSPSWDHDKIVELQKNYNNSVKFLKASEEYVSIPPKNKFKVKWKRVFIEEGIEEIIAHDENEALQECEENILQYEPLEEYYDYLQFETSIC